METDVLGLVLDTSVLIAAERRNLTAAQAIEGLKSRVGEKPLILSVITIAEIAHGIYRAKTPEARARRRSFLDDLKETIPIHALTERTAEIVAQVGGDQAEIGINLPLADLLIGACALELGYAVLTSNERDFGRIPGLRTVSL